MQLGVVTNKMKEIWTAKYSQLVLVNINSLDRQLSILLL